MSGVRAWLAERDPRPPDAALALPVEGGAGDVLENLITAGVAALERALAGQGERGGAFELLAGDALLTYACEWAAASPNPEEALRRILERVARSGG